MSAFKNSILRDLFFLFLGFFLLLYTTTLNTSLHWVVLIIIKIILIVFCLFITSVLFYKTCVNKTSRCVSAGLGSFIYAILCCFLLLESIFLFVPQSHHFAYTLAAKRWYNYYWKPINQFKYRDPLVNLNRKPDGDIILAMGDSFTAGYGINDYRDRFSNILDSKLPDSYLVLNFGINGGDSLSVIKQLNAISFKPNLTIIQHHANDILAINRILKKYSAGSNFDLDSMPLIPRILIQNSYFLNFIYWQIEPDKNETYHELLKSCYSDTEVLGSFLVSIQNIITLNKGKNIKTIFVLFPFLLSPEQSEEHTAVIEVLLKSKGIPYINVADLIKDIPPEKRVANRKDAHPSALVHKRVADALYDKMIEIGYITEEQ